MRIYLYLLIGLSALHAETVIEGRITGAVVSGVRVTAVAGEDTLSSVSDLEGRFRFEIPTQSCVLRPSLGSCTFLPESRQVSAGETPLFESVASATGEVLWLRETWEATDLYWIPQNLCADSEGGVWLAGCHASGRYLAGDSLTLAHYPADGGRPATWRLGRADTLDPTPQAGQFFVRPTDLAAHPEGGVVLVGWFKAEEADSLDIEGGPMLLGDQQEGFVARFDREGRCLWAHSVGGPGDDVLSRVDVNDELGIVLSGRVDPGAHFPSGIVAPGAEAHALGRGFFIARLTLAGRLSWVASASERISDLAVETGGQIRVCGVYDADLRLSGAGDTLTLELEASPEWRYGLFLASLDSEGCWEWVRSDGSLKHADMWKQAPLLTLDAHGNSYLVAAQESSPGLFGDPDGVEGIDFWDLDGRFRAGDFLVSHDASGRCRWATLLGYGAAGQEIAGIAWHAGRVYVSLRNDSPQNWSPRFYHQGAEGPAASVEFVDTDVAALAVYDSLGSVLAARAIDGNRESVWYPGMALAPDGTLYFAGQSDAAFGSNENDFVLRCTGFLERHPVRGVIDGPGRKWAEIHFEGKVFLPDRASGAFELSARAGSRKLRVEGGPAGLVYHPAQVSFEVGADLPAPLVEIGSEMSPEPPPTNPPTTPTTPSDSSDLSVLYVAIGVVLALLVIARRFSLRKRTSTRGQVD